MSETTRDVRRALVRSGIEPAGRLRVMASGRTVTDDCSLVVKLEQSPDRSAAYVADLEEFHRVGVPAEELLVRRPLRIGDRWATVVGYVHAVEPTQARHAEAVGRLLRQIHDLVWPYTEPRAQAEVYCPDDWRPENIIISATGPVMIDLDRAGAWPRSRAVQVAVDDFAAPLGQREPIQTAVLRGYGTHADLEVPCASRGSSGGKSG